MVKDAHQILFQNFRKSYPLLQNKCYSLFRASAALSKHSVHLSVRIFDTLEEPAFTLVRQKQRDGKHKFTMPKTYIYTINVLTLGSI